MPADTIDPAFRLPDWAMRRVGIDSEAEAAFLAGAALLALDRVIRTDPAWGGVWRQRQALKCAVSAVQLSGRREEEADLRDAWVLRKPGSDAGPSGRIYGAWKTAAARGLMLDLEPLQGTVGELGLVWQEVFEELPQRWAEVRRRAHAPSQAITDLIIPILALGRDYEPFAWWLADQLLRDLMQWPATMPLMMAVRNAVYFRAEKSQKRLSPTSDAFARAVALALADAAIDALRLAAQLDRRTRDLQAVVPKLRAKGAGDAIDLLLADDAVSGSLSTRRLSRFASRRLFDRLLAFGVIRELSGRPNFRVFGL